MSKTVEVIVDTAGQIKIDAVGFLGADCEQATAFLETALGQVSERQRKPEYRSRCRSVTKQRVGR